MALTKEEIQLLYATKKANRPMWELMEEWMFDHDAEQFDVHDVAEGLGVSVPEASQYIQAYLAAQRTLNSTTLYVLKREGRTASSRWSAGQRVTDGRIIGGTLFEDVSVKVHRAFEPDLKRLAERNPRAARYATKKIAAVVDGALVQLAVAVDMIEEDD
jgi:hypothetical protein